MSSNFLDSYKHLEKLCNEIFNNIHGVTSYIDEMTHINEMKNNPRGSTLVKGWDDDLKQLKRYRQIRNKIVHEPDCTEQNMCESGDTEWLDDFYSRIMKQTDPLSLYRKATNTVVESKRNIPQKSADCSVQQHNYYQGRKAKKTPISLILFIIFAIIIFFLLDMRYGIIK